jgi:hypothetical protein
MEDCGVVINVDDIRILTNMAGRTLQYLTLFPRALGTASTFLPWPEEHYITIDALDEIYKCRETHPHLTIYLKSEDTGLCDNAGPSSEPLHGAPGAGGIAGGVGVSVNRSTEGKRDYNRLVSLGHIAAFRMYDNQQLLPQLYFDNA